MLDIQYIKSNPQEIKDMMVARNLDDSIVDSLLEADEKKRKIQREREEVQFQRNETAKALEKLQDKKSAEAVHIIEKGKEIKKKLQELDAGYLPVEEEYQALLYQVPNIIDPTMPIGKSSDDNVEIKKVERENQFDFIPRDHVEIGKRLDIIDVERSAKVSGSRFGFLKKEGALLEFAILMHLTNKLLGKGFSPILPPVLVKEAAMYGTGYFPAEKSQAYEIVSDNIEDKKKLFLAGTGEVPTVSYHADEVFEESDLPLKYFAFSSCFRSEVGSWGKDVRGIKRVHQFDKLEMVVFSKPEESGELLEYLLSINEEFLQELQLPYHVLNMCSGDVGYPTYKKYDVEVFIPSQQAYCETMSTSNIHEYQARRLNIRYKNSEGKLSYVHTLNSTGAAMGRMILAIVENYQQKDGSIKVPDILYPYFKGQWPDGYIRKKTK